jgi:hypothetical protein
MSHLTNAQTRIIWSEIRIRMKRMDSNSIRIRFSPFEFAPKIYLLRDAAALAANDVRHLGYEAAAGALHGDSAQYIK